MATARYRLAWGPMREGKRACFYEHRIVMEQHLGRELHPGEHVHHINGDRRDNRIENLRLVDAATHARIHHTGVSLNPERRHQCVELAQAGLSQREIARRLGCDPSTVNRHLRAAAGNPRPKWRKVGQ